MTAGRAANSPSAATTEPGMAGAFSNFRWITRGSPARRRQNSFPWRKMHSASDLCLPGRNRSNRVCATSRSNCRSTKRSASGFKTAANQKNFASLPASARWNSLSSRGVKAAKSCSPEDTVSHSPAKPPSTCRTTANSTGRVFPSASGGSWRTAPPRSARRRRALPRAALPRPASAFQCRCR